MSRNISTELAPAAIGPYVQGVDLGSMIITSGQIGRSENRRRRRRRRRSSAPVAGKRQSDRRSRRPDRCRHRENHRVRERPERLRHRQRRVRSLLHRAQRAVPGPFLRGSGASAKRREDRNRSHRRASLIDGHAHHGQCRLAVLFCSAPTACLPAPLALTAAAFSPYIKASSRQTCTANGRFSPRQPRSAPFSPVIALARFMLN